MPQNDEHNPGQGLPPEARAGAPVPGRAVGGYGWPARPVLQLGEIWRWAWSQIKDQPLVLAGLPLWLVPSAILFPSLFSLLESVEGGLNGLLVLLIVLAFVSALLLSVTGLNHACLVIAQGRRLHVKDFFVIPHAPSAFTAMLITTVLVMLGNAFFIVAGLAIMYFFAFAAMIAADRGGSPFAAIRRSCSLVSRSNKFMSVFCITVLLYMAGTLTLVGWIILGPVQVLMLARSYVMLAEQPGALPHPGAGAYGGHGYPGPSGQGYPAGQGYPTSQGY